MLMCPFKRDDFKDKIDRSLADVRESGSSTTWVFSNHDVGYLLTLPFSDEV